MLHAPTEWEGRPVILSAELGTDICRDIAILTRAKDAEGDWMYWTYQLGDAEDHWYTAHAGANGIELPGALDEITWWVTHRYARIDKKETT